MAAETGPKAASQSSNSDGVGPKVLAEVREARETLQKYIDVIEADGRYPVDAFRFLQTALSKAVEMTHGPDAHKLADENAELRGEDHPNHVSARQLCLAFADLAAEHWGLLAKPVLDKWNIRQTSDVGEMVFLLVEHDLLQKTEGDRREDFNDVFPLSLLESGYSLTAGFCAEQVANATGPA